VEGGEGKDRWAGVGESDQSEEERKTRDVRTPPASTRPPVSSCWLQVTTASLCKYDVRLTCTLVAACAASILIRFKMSGSTAPSSTEVLTMAKRERAMAIVSAGATPKAAVRRTPAISSTDDYIGGGGGRGVARKRKGRPTRSIADYREVQGMRSMDD
jgi:hypothetical protein